MGEKSYVSMEQNVCSVCGATFDTGAILMNRRLHKNMEHYTVTGLGLCPEHRKLFDEGYVALVECDPERSGLNAGAARMKQEQAYRTGNVAHVRRKVFNQLFNVQINDKMPYVFVEPGVIERLQAMTQQPEQQSSGPSAEHAG